MSATPEPSTELVTVETHALHPAPMAVSPLPSQAEWNLILRQADIVSRSGIVPANYRTTVASDGRILQDKRPNVVVATLFGRTFGWDLMTSIRNVHVIEGAASLKPEAMLAMIRARGHRVSIKREDRAVEVHGRRADTGDEFTGRFSFEDAVRANLCTLKDGQPYARSKNGNPLGWETYPVDMCQWRAVAQLARGLFSDVVLGAGYTPEELGALVDIDGEVVESAPMPSPTEQVAAEPAQEQPQAAQDAPAAAESHQDTPAPAEPVQEQPAAPQTLEDALAQAKVVRMRRELGRRGPDLPKARARVSDLLVDLYPDWQPLERQHEAEKMLADGMNVTPATATLEHWAALAEQLEAEHDEAIRNRWEHDHGQQ